MESFPGADPYAQARSRGVKTIAATAHYATGELDAGPIITQEHVGIEQLGPMPSTAALRMFGRMTEVRVLTTALARHCRGEVLVYRGGTVHMTP